MRSGGTERLEDDIAKFPNCVRLESRVHLFQNNGRDTGENLYTAMGLLSSCKPHHLPYPIPV